MTALRFIGRTRAGGRVVDVAVRGAKGDPYATATLCGNLSCTSAEWDLLKRVLVSSPLARGTVAIDEPRDEVES